MEALLKCLSRPKLRYILLIAGMTTFSMQALAQEFECSLNDTEKDWAHISSYTDEDCNLKDLIKEAETVSSQDVDENLLTDKTTDKYENQDNQASRSLDKRKTNSDEEGGSQLKDDYTETVDWRWEGKDKL